MTLREEIRETLEKAKNPYAGPDTDIRIIGRQEVEALMSALEPVIAKAEQQAIVLKMQLTMIDEFVDGYHRRGLEDIRTKHLRELLARDPHDGETT